MSAPEQRLPELLANLRPALDPEAYAFVQLPPGTRPPPGIEPLASFRETEGTSLVVTAAAAARAGWEDRFPCRRITLQAHSALEAVGMLAAVAARLTEAGIPSNVVSAVHHDHLFVPRERADEAMEVLVRLQREARDVPGGDRD